MKLLIIVASLALSTAGCIVPSLTSLDTRLAAVGINPAPYRWNVEAQLRVADERRKGGVDAKANTKKRSGDSAAPRRKVLWASAVTTTGTTHQPVVGELTRASSSVRIPAEGLFNFRVGSIPDEHRDAVASVLSLVGAEKRAESFDLKFHSMDCSQRTRLGWLDLGCELEFGEEGAYLMSLSKGKVEGGVLKGAVVTHSTTASLPSIKYSLLCDSDAEDDEDTGKIPARAFALVLAVPSASAEDSHSKTSSNQRGQEREEGLGESEEADHHYDRFVEVVLRFTKTKDSALSSSNGDGEAPATVVGADGSVVYLLRGNTILSRWVLPIIYGLSFVFVLPYAATAATKALTPAPTVNLEKDGALQTSSKTK